MGVRINTNLEALNAQRNLSMVSVQFAKAVERLSSGLRINRAGDDAAGLSISEKLRAQVRGLNQAIRNAQDGISMIQTAEGALTEVHSMLQRMRELAVQAANDTLSDADREAINSELQQLKGEIDAISSRTKFNGQSLLSGDLAPSVASTSEVTVGTALPTGASAVVSKIDVSNAKGGGTTYTFSGSGTNLTLTRSGDSVSQTIDLSTLSWSGGEFVINFSQLGVKITLTGSSAKTAGNIVTDLTTATTDTITTAAASNSANFQIGPNSSDFLAVSFSEVKLTGATASEMSNLNTSLNNFNTTRSVSNAQDLVSKVDSAIAYVSEVRSNLGAYQNRLEHTIANLGVAAENLAASESRIRDADVAAETVQLVRSQILQQAGVSVLSQANQAPQAILALLR